METQLELRLRSGTGMIWVFTLEEDRAAARLPVNWVSDAAAAVAFGVQGFHVFGHRGRLPPERGLLGDDSWKTPAVV